MGDYLLPELLSGIAGFLALALFLAERCGSLRIRRVSPPFLGCHAFNAASRVA